MRAVAGPSSTRASTPSTTAPTFYADGSAASGWDETVDYVETPVGHYESVDDDSATSPTNPTSPLAEEEAFLVHLTGRKQAEEQLRGCGNTWQQFSSNQFSSGNVGGYLLRAQSQQAITSGSQSQILASRPFFSKWLASKIWI